MAMGRILPTLLLAKIPPLRGNMYKITWVFEGDIALYHHSSTLNSTSVNNVLLCTETKDKGITGFPVKMAPQAHLRDGESGGQH